MPQGCWFQGTIAVDANFGFHEKTGKPRAYFKAKIPANYQKKDSDKEYADWLWFEAWDDTANNIASLDLKQGDQVVVIGRVQSYQTETEGKKKDNQKIVVERVYKVAASETTSGH